MPTFTYKALTIDGLEIASELEAADRPSALRELASSGANVTEIAEKSGRALPFVKQAGRAKRLHIRPKQVAILTRQLATSLEAGLPLMTALEVISKELDHAPSRELLKQLGEGVQHGASLSDALAQHPNIFDPLYVSLVKVGESGGILDSILGQLADMMERQNELRDRVVTASIYPAILLLMGIASVIIIVAFIVPRIIEAIGADAYLLPWPTRVLMGISD
ncbi:MAG: type II secretion system F family protein, partial [Planctomycetota bacterium]